MAPAPGRVFSFETGHQLSGLVASRRAPRSMHSWAFAGRGRAFADDDITGLNGVIGDLPLVQGAEQTAFANDEHRAGLICVSLKKSAVLRAEVWKWRGDSPPMP